MNAQSLFNSYRDHSTFKLWEKANFGAYRNLPKTPEGKEKRAHQDGDKVCATGRGGLKQGVTFVIEDSRATHGFWHYYGAGMWHRSQDIAAVSS
jgi:hypothetical protein